MSLRMAFFSRLFKQAEGDSEILCDAEAFKIQNRQTKLRDHITPHGCFFVPECSLIMVLRHAKTFMIQPCKVRLGSNVALFSCGLIQTGSFCQILSHTQTHPIQICQHILGFGITGVG